MNIQKYILIKKPSYFFYITVLICFVILILIGNPIWRHVDDYKPLEVLFEAKKLKDYLKLFSYWGWGSYPPIWQYFSFFSYIFRPFGLDAVRNICFLLGFFSITISSILTYSICSLIKIDNLKKNKISLENYFIEFISVVFNVLNPEILIHSNSNMPYNISTITLQLAIILIFNCIKKDLRFFQPTDFILIKKNYLKIIILFSVLLTFQSTIIVSSLLITLIINYINCKEKIEIKNYFNPFKIGKSYFKLFQNIENIYFKRFVLITLSFFILMYGFKFLIIIFYKKLVPGGWANGINDVYNISFKFNSISEIINKISFSLRSIISQSLYPIRNGQVAISILLTIFIIYSHLKINFKNLFFRYFSIFSITTIILSISLSIQGNFIFAPTRHTIFLYPLFWIPIIIYIDDLVSRIKFKLFPIIFSIALFNFFSFGSNFSIKQISYSEEQNIEILKLLKKADFIFTNSFESFSNISLHGSEEFKLAKNKKCSKDKIKNLKSYKLFLYSHREPFRNTKDQLKYLSESNHECFRNEFKISILDRIEVLNKKDIEQNNLIENGGSSLYAYLISIIIE